MAGAFQGDAFQGDAFQSGLIVEVPAFVVTTTIPAPTTNFLIVEVPAFVLTTSVPPPTATAIAVAPALTVTPSIPVPMTAMAVQPPAFVVTTTVPVPIAGQFVTVPPFVVTATIPLPYVSGVGNEDGSPLTGPIRLFIDHFEMPKVEWNVSTEEVLGGVGRAMITVQDRENSDWEPAAHMDVLVVIRSSGWRLFHGETMQPSLHLPPGFPWRRWTIACRDYNAALDERAVGAPDGQNFWRPNAKEPYRPVDPVAVSYATDLATVRFWVGRYLNIGPAIDATMHVGQYIDNDILGDQRYAMDLQDATTMLRPALEQLASIADVNIQFGLDADDRFYWLAIPAWQDLVGNLDPTDLPDAPFAIVDSAPDGVTTIGHGGIDPGFDGQSMPEAIYVQGANTFVLDDDLNPQTQGSGWYPAIPHSGQRQAYLSVPSSWSVSRRDAAGEVAMLRARQQTLRGRVIVHGFTNAEGTRESRDGWRPWQLLSISDARLPASMKPGGRFVIQRVATTLLAGTDIRRYEIDFGDGPVGRASQGAAKRPPEEVTGAKARKPIVVWTADWQNFGPIGADETRDVEFTPRNGRGDPWGPPGLPVRFAVRSARDENGDDYSATQGSFSPNPTVTDLDGKARTTFTAGDMDGLTYSAILLTEVPPA